MKRLLIIVGIVLLGAALIFLNQGLRRSATPDKDEDEQAQQSKAQPPQAPAAQTDPKSILPPEQTVGDPATAKHHIQVGWVYGDVNQQKPDMLAIPIRAVCDYAQQSGNTAEVVDLDVPAEDRTPAARAVTELGIKVDGRTVVGGNLSELPFPPNQIGQAIEDAIRKK